MQMIKESLTKIFSHLLHPIAPLVVQPSVVIEDKERTCDSLLMCIVTVLSHGLRSGGGVGDVLRKPSKEVQKHNTNRRNLTQISSIVEGKNRFN